jgi:hypothetical protein
VCQCQDGKVRKKKASAIAIPQIKTLEEAEAHQQKHGFPSLVTARERQLNTVHGELDLRRFVERGQRAQAAVDAEIKKAKKLRGDKREMNNTEREFSFILEARKRTGEIVDWRFHAVKLLWGGCMIYTADFAEYRVAAPIRLIEVKGLKIWDRDIVRFKGCKAEWQHWFDFEMHQREKGGQWNQLL